jgi:hypothetical protein
VHPSSGIHGLRQPAGEARIERGRNFRSTRLGVSALLCAVALFAAGCHKNNQTSGAGVAWVTLTDQPGDFSSYIVQVDSITLTRSDGASTGGLLGPETVDFTKLSDLSELWGSATIPIGTYTSASIILDYTSAVISVMVGGVPQKATVLDSTGKAVTTQTINVILDPAGQLTVPATYATTSAQRLAIDFNLAASTAGIDTGTNPPTVRVKPYLTVGVAASDQKLIRVRGPLINSSVSLGTYTVYVRPFLDEFDNFGSLSLFVDPSTIFTTNGVVATGTTGCAAAKDCGITQLSQSSAGTTVTAAYTTFEPTATPNATAGKFHAKYVIAGSTLEDPYTSGLEGDVVSRTGNSLKVRGSTLQLYTGGTTGTSIYNVADATVTLGPATIVTADDTTLTGLNYNSVAVGQHIVVRGIYSAPSTGVVDIDATGSTVTNGGSVRLISTHLWGSLVSSGAGALSLNLQTINNWPVSDFTFTGNGTSAATDPVATAFNVSTGTLTVPVTTVSDPLWIDGLVAPFGSAPPAFDATAISSEASVPASLQVRWTGTATPFSALNAAGLSINLTNATIASAIIRVGPESIALASLPASPQFTVVPQAGTAINGLPVFTPRFSYGDPTAVAPAGIHVFSAFGTFATDLTAALATTSALVLEARGTYNRATNTFSASSVDVVL